MTDFFVAAADDFRFGLMQADHQHFVQDEGIGDDQEDVVEALLRVGKCHLEKQDQEIKTVEQDGNRKPEFFVQDQGRNIHPSRGSADPDNDADPGADHQAAENGAQHMVARYVGQDRETLPERQGSRVEKGADQGGEGKFFAQDECAGSKHDQVEGKDERGHGNVQKAVGGQGQPRGAAGDDAAGQDKSDHGQGVQGVPGQDHQDVADVFENGKEVFSGGYKKQSDF